jgi:ectoine hydroxylase-related dioxygenase (phytanoyl-CoA dioxygenase family)
MVGDLNGRGIALSKGFVPPAQYRRIRAFLESRDAIRRNSVRDDYRPEHLLESPDIRALIADPFIRNVAAAYLGSTPIFTHLAAWRSRSDPGASADDLSEAAQLYHYDYDWPAFVKFFIYLTDVGPDNGPFTFVVGTHERKRHWKDGRRDDSYIASTYPNGAWAVTGQAGDLIIADTVGYHKGERVREGERLMLQFEFAVSRIGASFQYDPLPAKHRPDPSITFDVFSA